MSVDTLSLFSKEILMLFQKLPLNGFDLLRQKLNPLKERGVYAIEISSTDAEELLNYVSKHKNIGPLVEVIHFYRLPDEWISKFDEMVRDESFFDAVHTHSIQDTFVICSWIYAGENAAKQLRKEEDIGITWCAIEARQP